MVETHDLRPCQFRQIKEELVVVPFGISQRGLGLHINRFVLRVCFVFRRADVYTQVAASAILGRYLNRERLSFVLVPSVIC